MTAPLSSSSTAARPLAAPQSLPVHDERRRADALRAVGASPSVVAELLAYGASAFDETTLRQLPSLPLADEPFVQAWTEYVDDAHHEGVIGSLRRRLVQLDFPIREGMSERDDYRAATRRGELRRAPFDSLELDEPDTLQLLLHPTIAGRIPVIIVSRRADFVRLIQAFTHRNEPAPVPDSMGACIVGGYNNWDRVRRLRAEWEREHPSIDPDSGWPDAFRALMPRKELYQDRFILLSAGPYSATPADALGFDTGEWLRLSSIIRLEHECTHYFTRRVFGSMRNTLLDELCADYAGIVAAAGHFRADWFLRFVGLDEPSRYRAGARLENYRGAPALSDDAFLTLQRVVRGATLQLSALDHARRARGPLEVTSVVVAVARLGLELLASDDGASLLDAELARVESPRR